ncbi:MAG: hypothetical protein HFI33_13200 [Lachnospiraceae bacterium]|nr:hypothetical protein [Lachnospiraceae bacterium]
MEVVRQFIDAKKLMSVLSLPDAFKNRKLEVIVFPVEESEKTEAKKAEIGNIMDSLVGSIPDNGMTLNEYRLERLSKYEAVD